MNALWPVLVTDLCTSQKHIHTGRHVVKAVSMRATQHPPASWQSAQDTPLEHWRSHSRTVCQSDLRSIQALSRCLFSSSDHPHSQMKAVCLCIAEGCAWLHEGSHSPTFRGGGQGSKCGGQWGKCTPRSPQEHPIHLQGQRHRDPAACILARRSGSSLYGNLRCLAWFEASFID